jgi:hypothetical protein
MVDYRKYGRLLAAPDPEKIICTRCGCLFLEDSYGNDTCQECNLESVLATQAREAAFRGRRLAQVTEALRTHTQILQAIWETREANPGWYHTVPNWVASVRSLRVTKALLENQPRPSLFLPLGCRDIGSGP